MPALFGYNAFQSPSDVEEALKRQLVRYDASGPGLGGFQVKARNVPVFSQGEWGGTPGEYEVSISHQDVPGQEWTGIVKGAPNDTMMVRSGVGWNLMLGDMAPANEQGLLNPSQPPYVTGVEGFARRISASFYEASNVSETAHIKPTVNSIFQQMNTLRSGQRLSEYMGMGDTEIGVLPPQSLFIRPEESTATNIRHLTQRYNISYAGDLSSTAKALNEQFNFRSNIPPLTPGEAVTGYTKLAGGYSYADKYFVPPTAHGETWLKPLPESPGQFEPVTAGMTEKIWKHKHIMGRRPSSPFMVYRPEMGKGAGYEPGRLLPLEVPGYIEPESVTTYSGDPTTVGMRMTSVTPIGGIGWQSGQAQIGLPEPVRHKVVEQMGGALVAADAAQRRMYMRGASIEDLTNLSINREMVGKTLDPGQRYTIGKWGGKPNQVLGITASQQIQQIENLEMVLPREWGATDEALQNIAPLMRQLEGQGITSRIGTTLEKGPYLEAQMSSGAPIAFKGGDIKPQVNIPFLDDVPQELRGTNLQASAIPYDVMTTTKNWDVLMAQAMKAMPIEGKGGVFNFMKTLFPEAEAGIAGYQEELAGATPSMRGLSRAIGGYETGTHLLLETTNRALQTGREYTDVDQGFNRRLFQQFGVGRTIGTVPVQQFTPETRKLYRRQIIESLMGGEQGVGGTEALRIARQVMKNVRETSPGVYTQYQTGEVVVAPKHVTGVTETGGVGSQGTQFDVDAVLAGQGFEAQAEFYRRNRAELFPTTSAQQAIKQAAYAWQTTVAREAPQETRSITIGQGGLDPAMVRALGRERTAGMKDYDKLVAYGELINELSEQPPGTPPRMLRFPGQNVNMPHPLSMHTLEATAGVVEPGELGAEGSLITGTGSHLSTKTMKTLEGLLSAEARGVSESGMYDSVTNLLEPLLGSDLLFKERGGMFSRVSATALLQPHESMLTREGMERMFFLSGGTRERSDMPLAEQASFQNFSRNVLAGVQYRPPGTMLGTAEGPGALMPTRIMTPSSRLGRQVGQATWQSGIMQPNVINSTFLWASQGDADVDPFSLYAATYQKGDKWYSFMQSGGNDPQYKEWLGRIQKYLSPDSQRRAMQGYYGEYLPEQMPFDEQVRDAYLPLSGSQKRLEAGRATTELTQIREQTDRYNVNKRMGMGVTYNTWIRRSEAAGAYLGAPDIMTRRTIDMTAGLPYSQAVDMNYEKRYWESLMNSAGFGVSSGQVSGPGDVIVGGYTDDNPQAGDWSRLGINDPHKRGGGKELAVNLGYMLATDRGANPEGIAGMLLNYPAGMEGTQREVAAKMQPRLEEVTKRLTPLMERGGQALHQGITQLAEEGLIGERSFAVTSFYARAIEKGQRDPSHRQDLIEATARRPLQLYGKEWQWEELEREFAPVNQLYEFSKRSPTRGVADMHLEFRNLQGVGGVLSAAEQWGPGRTPNVVERLQRSFGMHFPSGQQSDVDPAYTASLNRSYERILRQSGASARQTVHGPGFMLPDAVREAQEASRRSRAGSRDATPEEIAAVNAMRAASGGGGDQPPVPPATVAAPATPPPGGGGYQGQSTGAGVTGGGRQQTVYTEPKPLPNNYSDIWYQQAQTLIRSQVGTFAGNEPTGEFTPGPLTQGFNRMREMVAAQFPQEYRQSLLATDPSRLMSLASELAPAAGVNMRELVTTGEIGETFWRAKQMKGVVGGAAKHLGSVSAGVNDMLSTGMIRALSGHPGKITGGGEVFGAEFGGMMQHFEAWNKVAPSGMPKGAETVTPTQMGIHQRSTGIDLSITEDVKDFIGNMDQFKKTMKEAGTEVKTSSENLETFSKVTKEELGKLFSDEGDARIQKAKTNLVKAEAMRWQAAQAITERFPQVGRVGPGGRLSGTQLLEAQARAQATGRVDDLGLVSGYTGAEAAAEQQLLSAAQTGAGGGGGGGRGTASAIDRLGRMGRRMFGGFGLMYMRSIAGIITGGSQLGYAESMQQRAEVEGAMGARFGGMMPQFAPDEEVTRAQAMYGGFGWGGLRTLQSRALRSSGGAGTVMAGAQAGVGAAAMGAWMAMMNPALGPLIAPMAGLAVAGTVGLTAYGAAQQPELTGVNIAREAWQTRQSFRDPNRSWGQSMAGTVGAALSPANLGRMWADIGGRLTGNTTQLDTMDETAEIMTAIREAEGRGEGAMEYLRSRGDLTEGQVNQYSSLYANWKISDYPTVPVQGLAQAFALQGEYGLQIGGAGFGQFATGLAQGIPYEEMGMMVGYSPGATFTQIRESAGRNIENWVGQGGLTAEDMARLQRGGTRYQQLGVFAPRYPDAGTRSIGGYAPGTFAAVTGQQPYRTQEQYLQDLGEIPEMQFQLMAQQARIAETFTMAGFDYAMPQIEDYQGAITPEQYQRRYQEAYPKEMRGAAVNQWRTAAGQVGVFQAPTAFGPEGPATTSQITMGASQFQFGAGMAQRFLGGGIEPEMAQAYGAAFGYMEPSQFSMYSGMMQGNPLRWAQWAQRRPGAAQALASSGLGPFAATMPGLGGNIPIGNLFMTDVNQQGDLTGLPWGTTSLATPLASSAAMGNMVFGSEAGTPAAQALIEGGRWGLQRYQIGLQAGYQATQAGIQMRRIGLQREYQPQFWNIQDQQRQLGYEQQEWQFDFRERQMDMQNRFWEQNFALNQQQAQTQRTWTRQDWGYQDQVRGLQWGWKIEDYGEQVRFMTGRQRRIAERQMRRDVTMHGLEGDQIDRQRARQEELWNVEDKRFDIQRQQHEESVAMQEEQLAKQRQFFEERKALEEEMVQLQREYWEKNIALTEEAANASAAYADAQNDIAMRMQELQEYTETARASLDLMNNESWAYLIELLEDLDPILANIIKTAIAGIEGGGGIVPGAIPSEDFPEDWKPGDPLPTSSWICNNCGEENPSSAFRCKNCGRIKDSTGGRQRGGRVKSGETVWVGEMGPEKVIMGGDGYVVPSYRANPWEKEQMFFGDSTGSQVVHLVLNVGGHQLAELVTDIVDKEIDV